jgi:hypothetical protein
VRTFECECARCGGAYSVTVRACPGGGISASVRGVRAGRDMGPSAAERAAWLLPHRGEDPRRFWRLRR